MKTSSVNHPNTSTELLLSIADINTEIQAANAIEKCDFSIPRGGLRLLREKLRRSGATADQIQQFIGILDLEQLPDIRPAVESGSVSMRDILAIATNRNCRKFRHWMRQAESHHADDLVRSYHRATRQIGATHWPTKIFRFITTATIGTINPGAGLIAAAGDSFFYRRVDERL